MKKIILLSIILISLFGGLLTVRAASTAEEINAQMQATAGSAGIAEVGTMDPRMYISWIKIALGTVGTVFLVMIVWGGYNFVTSGGDEEKAKKGTDMIKAAVTGIIIILAAWGITQFVSTKISAAVVTGAKLDK